LSSSRREDKDDKEGKFEALDFVLGVLREDVNNLGRIVADLEKIAGVMGKPNEIGGRLDSIETQLASTRAEIAGLITSLAREPSAPAAKPNAPRESYSGTPIIVSCRVWEDFRTLARGADQAAFASVREDTFEIGAQRGSRIYKYVGKLPPYSTVIRAWLARELEVPDPRIIEGDLTLR
jgi:hypothetical protein